MTKTTRKEIIEEFDQTGKLITRTTTEETVIEDNSTDYITTPSTTNTPWNDYLRYYSTSTSEVK